MSEKEEKIHDHPLIAHDFGLDSKHVIIDREVFKNLTKDDRENELAKAICRFSKLTFPEGQKLAYELGEYGLGYRLVTSLEKVREEIDSILKKWNLFLSGEEDYYSLNAQNKHRENLVNQLIAGLYPSNREELQDDMPASVVATKDKIVGAILDTIWAIMNDERIKTWVDNGYGSSSADVVGALDMYIPDAITLKKTIFALLSVTQAAPKWLDKPDSADWWWRNDGQRTTLHHFSESEIEGIDVWVKEFLNAQWLLAVLPKPEVKA